MGFIDTDTHVIECEESWDYLEPSEREHRPVTVEVPVKGSGPKQMYLIGETFCRRFPSNGQGSGFGAEYSPEVSHLRDPAVRLRKMDALGIDAQIVISTNFIAAELDNPLAEAAVMRSWNRWMADRTASTGGRLRWALVCPTRTLSRACEELEFGKAHGAAGIMIKGVDHGYYLSDPYFYPLYEKAQELDLTMVVHQGAARHHIEGLGIASRKTSTAAHLHYTSTVMKGFYAVLDSDLNERFPRLRWAFVESGASCVPFAFHHLARARSASKSESFVQTARGPSRVIHELHAAEEMEARNLYVACETDEDLPYLTSMLGDRHIMCGTDMCHNDNGSDPLAHTVIAERTDIPPAVARRIVDTNGRNAFGIAEDFTPTARVSAATRREVDLAVL
jgi:predicted TIM-barrel fold metal-dependent hydrolase